MCGRSSRPFTVGELLDGLRRAAGDRCGVGVDQGARQLQLTGLGDRWAVDQEEQFDREADGAARRPDKEQSTDAQRCKSVQSSARTCERVHCCLLHGNAGQPLCCIVGTPSTCSVCRSPFCSAGRWSTMLCWRSTRLAADLLAWHFILLTYQVKDNLYIRQLEEKMTHIRMGEQESVMDYCNRARRILAEIRMAGPEYSTASYITHVLKGLPRSYNLMKRMTMVPGTRESLDEDSLTSYIIQDEAMQEAEQPMELLLLANYAAPTKQSRHQEQRRKPRGGGSGGGRSTKDVDEKRSTRDKGRGGGGRRRELPRPRPPFLRKPRKEKQTSKKTSSTKDVDNSSGKSRGDGEASYSMAGVVELTVSLVPEAGEDFQVVAAAVQANPMAVLLDSGCSHHLMGMKVVFFDMAPSDSVKHVRGFNGALQPVEGRGTVALQGEAGKRVLIPDVLYVPGVQANLLSAGQLKESGVQLQGDGDEMLLVAATREVLGRARYTGRVLCTDLRPCLTRSPSTEVVAMQTIISATKSTPDRLHARLAHVGVDTIKSSAKHEVATRLDIKLSIGADLPCVSCVGGKMARHTFPNKGSDTEEALVVVHVDLCGPFRVATKDGSLCFQLLKDRHTRFVWAMPVAKKSDVLWELQRWLQNGMAEREMRTVVESVRTMLLHMGVQHHWWHLALRQAVWVRNCLERSTNPPGTTPYQLLTGKKPDLTLVRVWGCMVQFMVPEQQRGRKLAPKAHWGLHLGKVWAGVGADAGSPADGHLDELANEDVVEVLPPPLVLAPPSPIADRPTSTHVSATGDEGSLEALPVAPASGIAGGQQGAKLVDQDGKPSTTEEKQTREPVEQEAAAGVQSTGEQQTGQSIGELSKSAEGEQPVEGSKHLVDDVAVDKEGELSAGEESIDIDVVEVPVEKPELRCTGRTRKLPERLVFHACLPRAAFTTVYDEVDDDLLYDDAEDDIDVPELDPDVHTNPEHRWDIATMTVKEALASWKGEAVKVAMEEEIRSLIGMGTWELIERPCGVNIMKSRWVLTTKYLIDNTVERENARLVVKGFTQMYGVDYDKTYSLVSSYVTLRIILSIVAVLNLNLM
ncbi:unnamed protein product [Closterium sp. NIES-54]